MAKFLGQSVITEFLVDIPVRLFFGVFNLLPHRIALALAGWITKYLLAPPFGVNRRIRENLTRVWPDMKPADQTRLCREISDNSARLMLETFLPQRFVARAREAALLGPGCEILLEALAAEKPVILVSGHFGNFQAVRVALADRGYASAGIYRPMNNRFTNARYVRKLDRIAAPNFSRGISGTKALLGHLRKGGMIALLNDQAAAEGRALSFFGHPALTMTSAAEFARKYQALLFPCYGVRLQDGASFRVEVERPISGDDPVAMTQALNDSLESVVRRYPGQWFWVHRRWKTWG